MNLTMLKCKIHRATVTGADLHYEGSVSVDPVLLTAAGLNEFEAVDIYNINNGARLSTYVIPGRPGEICLNGAAARLVHKGDLVIIAAFASLDAEEARTFLPKVVHVDLRNQIASVETKVRTDIKSELSRPVKPNLATDAHGMI